MIYKPAKHAKILDIVVEAAAPATPHTGKPNFPYIST